jgi:hypothetical protein
VEVAVGRDTIGAIVSGGCLTYPTANCPESEEGFPSAIGEIEEDGTIAVADEVGSDRFSSGDTSLGFPACAGVAEISRGAWGMITGRELPTGAFLADLLARGFLDDEVSCRAASAFSALRFALLLSRPSLLSLWWVVLIFWLALHRYAKTVSQWLQA